MRFHFPLAIWMQCDNNMKKANRNSIPYRNKKKQPSADDDKNHSNGQNFNKTKK